MSAGSGEIVKARWIYCVTIDDFTPTASGAKGDFSRIATHIGELGDCPLVPQRGARSRPALLLLLPEMPTTASGCRQTRQPLASPRNGRPACFRRRSKADAPKARRDAPSEAARASGPGGSRVDEIGGGALEQFRSTHDDGQQLAES